MRDRKSGILGLGLLSRDRPRLLEKVDGIFPELGRGFCKGLDADILDEEKAIEDYGNRADELYKNQRHLPDVAEVMKDHATILGIRNDEMRHKKLLEDIKRRQCACAGNELRRAGTTDFGSDVAQMPDRIPKRVRCERDYHEFVPYIKDGFRHDKKQNKLVPAKLIHCPKCHRGYVYEPDTRQWMADRPLTILE